MRTRIALLSSAVCLSAVAALLAAADVTPKRYGTWGFDLSTRDLGVKPGDSFFDYANGAWYRKAEIPPDQPSLSVGYDVFNLSQNQLRAVIEEAASNPSSPTARKIGDLYAAFMDEGRVEAAGDASLKADLARVAALGDKAALAEHMGRTSATFGGSLFGAYVDPDPKDPNRYAFLLAQSGLGMPDRDYYLTDTFKVQRAAYEEYVGRALAMAGWPDARNAARSVVAFETKVAEASWPAAERRDVEKTYNPMSIDALETLAPGFPWKAYLRGAGVPLLSRVVVNEKSAFPAIASVFANTPLDTLRAWQAFHTIDQASPYLPTRYVDSRFAFRGKALSGLEQNRPRWKRAVTLVDGSLGEAVGQQYVAKYFPPAAKAEMERLVANLKVAMAARIRALAWMSDSTKAEALEKLDRMRVRVGHPNAWRDYEGLAVSRDDLYGNVVRSNAFEWAYRTGKLGKPVDQEEWYMTPQTVNAYSDPSRNVIVFPAAILQAPYFALTADPAINYGAIGGVIGHEISHGFDDQGRKYDAKGELRDWWTKEDAARFEAQSARLVTQYGTYEVAPGLPVNGQLTLGENIADVAGLTLALDAYRASLGGKPAPVIDGLTGDQRVFLGWAQAWQSKQRDDAVKQQVASDPHSPARFRVDGPVRNIDAWYEAFGVKPGDRLFLTPAERARIW